MVGESGLWSPPGSYAGHSAGRHPGRGGQAAAGRKVAWAPDPEGQAEDLTGVEARPGVSRAPGATAEGQGPSTDTALREHSPPPLTPLESSAKGPSDHSGPHGLGILLVAPQHLSPTPSPKQSSHRLSTPSLAAAATWTRWGGCLPQGVSGLPSASSAAPSACGREAPPQGLRLHCRLLQCSSLDSPAHCPLSSPTVSHLGRRVLAAPPGFSPLPLRGLPSALPQLTGPVCSLSRPPRPERTLREGRAWHTRGSLHTC